MTLVPQRSARAFAPSHVTGLFVPDTSARDPRGRGSRGAGLVLDVGVTAEVRWDPARIASLRLRSEPTARLEITREVVRRLLRERRGALDLRLRHTLPIGQGFGSSAAGALSAGLAVAEVLGAPSRRAVELAHLADLFGRGGLGGVAAVLGGGLEVRTRAGLPPRGRVLRRAVQGRVLVGTVGPPLRSPEVLSRSSAATGFDWAQPLVDRVAASPTLETLVGAAEEFTDRAGLASRRLRDVLRGLRRRRLPAFQAMFGESFVALPGRSTVPVETLRWLAGRGIPALLLEAGSEGAHRLRSLRGSG